MAQEEEEAATGKEGRMDGVKQATAAVYIKELRQGFESASRGWVNVAFEYSAKIPQT